MDLAMYGVLYAEYHLSFDSSPALESGSGRIIRIIRIMSGLPHMRIVLFHCCVNGEETRCGWGMGEVEMMHGSPTAMGVSTTCRC